jgi:hypothetical protein
MPNVIGETTYVTTPIIKLNLRWQMEVIGTSFGAYRNNKILAPDSGS